MRLRAKNVCYLLTSRETTHCCASPSLDPRAVVGVFAAPRALPYAAHRVKTQRHSAALRSVCGGLAAAGEDGALDDVAGAASTGRIGGRPHRSRCNEPASRT